MGNQTQIFVGVIALLIAIALSYIFTPEWMLRGWIVPVAAVVILTAIFSYYRFGATAKDKRVKAKTNADMDKASRLSFYIGVRVLVFGVAYFFLSIFVFPGFLGPVGIAFVVFPLSIFVGLLLMGFRLLVWLQDQT